MNGRKRHVIVDTQGLTLEVAVHPADVQDRDGAKLALWLNKYRKMSKDCERLVETSEAWIRIAMINPMLRRLVV